MAERTENDTLVEVAQQAVAGPDAIDPGQIHSVMLPAGVRHDVVDLERFLDAPRRTRATVQVHTADSLGAYVIRHKNDVATTLYADDERARIVAVLNDAGRDVPGWGDHRAVLQLRLTKPWLLWAGADGGLMGQADFAEHIEAGVTEIVDPPAAEMLELAQSFEATRNVQFRSAHRLQDGQRALRYEETMESRAGQAGDITIPKSFGLLIAPYEGSEPQEFSARLRYRIDGSGNLKIGYVLVRPHDVLRIAFESALGAIERDTELKAFRGTPPERT